MVTALIAVGGVLLGEIELCSTLMVSDVVMCYRRWSRAYYYSNNTD